MQICEYFFENACYSVTKYYLCKQNNKRSLLGRKQRHQVVRSFPNRYLFSLTNKVTYLFPISCILEIILSCNFRLNGKMCTHGEVLGFCRRYEPFFRETTSRPGSPVGTETGCCGGRRQRVRRGHCLGADCRTGRPSGEGCPEIRRRRPSGRLLRVGRWGAFRRGEGC